MSSCLTACDGAYSQSYRYPVPQCWGQPPVISSITVSTQATYVHCTRLGLNIVLQPLGVFLPNWPEAEVIRFTDLHQNFFEMIQVNNE